MSPTAAAAVGRRHNSAPGEQLGRSSNEAENVEDSSHPEERSSDESKHRHSKKPMPRVSAVLHVGLCGEQGALFAIRRVGGA